MQGEQAVADQVPGRFVPSDQQQLNVGEDLLRGKPPFLAFGVQQSGDQVVARIAAAAGEEVLEIVPQFEHDGILLVDLSAGQGHWVDDAGIDEGSAKKPAAVPLWNAQHVADHGHRQGMREVMDDVHGATCRDRVEQFMRDRPNAWPHGLNPASCESLCDQSTQSGMVRWIAHEQAEPQKVEHWLLERSGAVQMFDEREWHPAPGADL